MTPLPLNDGIETTQPPLSLEPHTDPVSQAISDYVQAFCAQAAAFVSSFKTQAFSWRIYSIIQISLSAIACTGYAITLLIYANGFTKMALITSLLSTANFAGAYAAYEANLRHSLQTSVDRLEAQVAELSLINTELKTTSEELKATSEDLKETNENLKIQVELFEEQNEELRNNILDFTQANQRLSSEILHLTEEVTALTACNQELRETSTQLKDEVSRLRAQNEEFRLLTRTFQEDCGRYQQLTHTQSALVQRFTEQVAASDRVHSELNHCHAELISQHTEALRQLNAPELRDALRQDIQEAAQELSHLRTHLDKLLLEVQTTTAFLEELKKEHRQILTEYRATLQLAPQGTA